jgi:flagellar basal-body rod modification protein FlgD
VKILLTELTNQDPLQPNDSQAILEQLSSLRNIESQLSLQEKLEQLTLQNSLSQAGGLIGKVVEGIDPNDQKVNGKVVSVRLGEKGAELELDTGRKLLLEKVSRITDGSTLATAA